MRVRQRNLIITLCGLIFVVLFLSTGWLWRMLRPVIHKDIINRYAGEYKFDPLFIMALVKVESNFVRKARSHRGAVGLMQLLPSTAQEMAQELGLTEFSLEDLEKPEINIMLGYHYLSKLREQTNNDMIQMLAAYNGGYQNMVSWKKDTDTLELKNITFKETREFVQRVLKTYRYLKKIQKFKKIIEFN